MPKNDLFVQVRPQAWEVPPAVSHAYDGIFNVSLNQSVNVMFVPEFNRYKTSSELPDDIDSVGSFEEARRISAELSDYVVTPNDAKAGQAEQFIRDGLDGPIQGVVYYVTAEQFELVSEELARLADEYPSVKRGCDFSKIRDLAIASLLVSVVISSPLLLSRHRAILGL